MQSLLQIPGHRLLPFSWRLGWNRPDRHRSFWDFHTRYRESNGFHEDGIIYGTAVNKGATEAVVYILFNNMPIIIHIGGGDTEQGIK